MYETLDRLSCSLSRRLDLWINSNPTTATSPQAEYLVSVLRAREYEAISENDPGQFQSCWVDAMALSPQEPMFHMMRRCHDRLIDFVTGETDGVKVIFDGEGIALWKQLQRESFFMEHYSRLAADLLLAIAPMGSRLLEVGAGTGATTQHIMRSAHHNKFASYVFSDVSPAFLLQARRDFDSDPSFSTRLFDINLDPWSQFGADAVFDFIVAVNVLHVADDPRAAFEHVSQLLAPGGTLVLSEGMPEPTGAVWAAEPVFAFLPQWAKDPERRAAMSGFYDWHFWEAIASNSGLILLQPPSAPWHSSEMRGGVTLFRKPAH